MAALTASCIDLNIQGNGTYSVLKQLATMALQNGFITDSHQFLQTLLLREKMHSTGFGSGIAVPHGKSACVKQPFVLFARKTQAIDWQASDGEDVNCWICSAYRKAAKRIRSKSSAHCVAKLSIRILSTNCDKATPTRCLLC